MKYTKEQIERQKNNYKEYSKINFIDVLGIGI